MNNNFQVNFDKYPDVLNFLQTIKKSAAVFDEKTEIFITRAPGRLDVMGGIADYSGSLVLEMPIKEAAMVGLQKSNDRNLKIISHGAKSNNRTHYFEMPLEDFQSNGVPIEYSEAKKRFQTKPSESWAAYIAGAFLVLMREKNIIFENGAVILIDSKVPEGKGVSSSAAIEVATMRAISAAFQIELHSRELAILCQKVENEVVGAPCGIMDQMSSVCGEKDQLLSMICQPAELRGSIEISDEISFWGIDSGVRHSVGAGNYGSVRTGAFMGYRIIAGLAGLDIRKTKIDGVVEIDDQKWNGYLANISPDEFEKNFLPHLPFSIGGAEFLSKYQGITDRATKILPEQSYDVLNPTAHPIYENRRVNQFAKFLTEPSSESNLKKLGKLMFQSHKSYTNCGLGTLETDLLVGLAQKSDKLYGAKITGGGSGGTVAMLGRKEARLEIEKICEEFQEKTSHSPHIFSGSSVGAARFGHLKICLKEIVKL